MKIQKRKYTIAKSIYILIKNDVEKKFNPKNEMIKIPSTYPASKFTQQKASTLRTKDEIKCLCTKEKTNETNALIITLDIV
jgi:hypothetical protein